MKPNQFIPVKDLAVILKMDRSAALKYIRKLGYSPEKKKTATTGYQTANCLTTAQAQEVVRQRKSEGYL